MIDLNGIKRRLQDRRLDKIALATNLSKQTIINIREGRTEPNYGSMKALSDYFEAQEAPGQVTAETAA